MYSPALFKENDVELLHALIENNSFGMLTAVGPTGAVEIAHLPFLLDRSPGTPGCLRVHTAYANPIWRASLAAQQVTAVFLGPHGYVSPRWYEHPLDNVPTWNYAVVHAHGRAEGPMPLDGLRSLISELADRYEGGSPDPWRFDQLNPVHRDKMLSQIVGLNIRIERLEGKRKLSQNRSEADRTGIREALRQRGTPDDLAMLALIPEP